MVTIPSGREGVGADTFCEFTQPTVSNISQSEKLWPRMSRIPSMQMIK